MVLRRWSWATNAAARSRRSRAITSPWEQIQQIAPKMFAKAEPDSWMYVKWSDACAINCKEDRLTGTAIAKTLDGEKTCKKKPK